VSEFNDVSMLLGETEQLRDADDWEAVVEKAVAVLNADRVTEDRGPR